MPSVVSVIVPNRNYSKYLRECLSAIFNQTYQWLEVIFVDDGSTDQSLDIAYEFGNRLRIFSQEHQGVNAARNLGLRNATGKYVAFCDSDDVWFPNKLEQQVKFLEENTTVGLVYSGIQLVDENLKFIQNIHPRDAGNCAREFLKRPGEAIVLLGASTALMQRRLIAESGAFDEMLRGPAEDWDFFRRVAEVTPINFIFEPLVYYRQHSFSASRVSNDKYFEGNRQAMRKLYRENRLQISRFACRMSWLKLHWSFFKTEMRNRYFSSAIKQLILALTPIDF